MSKPDIRMRILAKMEELKFAKAENIQELKAQLDMSDVSNTQFSLALRSLHYRYRRVHVGRPHAWGPYRGPRIYQVTYLSEAERTTIPLLTAVQA